MQVLVVDDSMVARNIIKNVLQPIGYEVLQAANGQEALDILKSKSDGIALVLLDWNMPVLSGIDTLKAVRQNKQFDHIRVLMVSTESEDDYIDRAIQSGANGYLAKPFTPEELAAKISSTIEGR
jgi:two-component system, chemotaxis family, chemotaxis protein CheY